MGQLPGQSRVHFEIFPQIEPCQRALPTARLSVPQAFVLPKRPRLGAEYLVYAPSGGSFTVDLSAMPSARTLAVEWFNPSTGAVIAGNPIPAGSSAQAFTPPFSGDAVLYLVDRMVTQWRVAADRRDDLGDMHDDGVRCSDHISFWALVGRVA